MGTTPAGMSEAECETKTADQLPQPAADDAGLREQGPVEVRSEAGRCLPGRAARGDLRDADVIRSLPGFPSATRRSRRRWCRRRHVPARLRVHRQRLPEGRRPATASCVVGVAAGASCATRPLRAGPDSAMAAGRQQRCERRRLRRGAGHRRDLHRRLRLQEPQLRRVRHERREDLPGARRRSASTAAAARRAVGRASRRCC